ncbi:MAG: hypothetical protein CMQ24_19980, partial [Gammaproteobacteria bacterium]|nr:hypothetical protein [Gammaproteobacteria bacterium]
PERLFEHKAAVTRLHVRQSELYAAGLDGIASRSCEVTHLAFAVVLGVARPGSSVRASAGQMRPDLAPSVAA